MFLNKYYLEDQIEDNEMGRVRGTYGRNGNVCSVLVAKHEGKRLLGRCSRRWEINTKIDLKEIGREGTD